jgi:hypothetical protein
MAPLMGLAGTTAQVGLSGVGGSRFVYAGATLNGREVDAGSVPAVHIGLDGSITDTLTVNLTPRCFTLTTGAKVGLDTAPNCPGTDPGKHRYLAGTAVSMYFSGNPADTFYSFKGADATNEKLAVVIMNRDREVTADFHSASGLELAVKIISSVEQRIIAALVAAATGIAGEILFVVQAASLAVVGIATVLEVAGVHGTGIDAMKNSVNAVGSSMAVVTALQDCTMAWAGNGGAPPLSPSSAIAQTGVSVGTGVADKALEELDNERASGAFGALASAYDLTNVFATGIEGYLAEPADSWASIVDIGSCVADTGRDAGKAWVTVGHS